MILYPNSLLEKLGFEHVRETTLRATQSVQSHERILELLPLSFPNRVRQLLNQTQEMITLLSGSDSFALNDFPDIRPHIQQSRVEGTLIPLYAFSEVLKVCAMSRLVKQQLKKDPELHPQLFAISEAIVPLKELESYIKGKITETGELRDDASPELKSIRKRLNSRKNELRSTVNRLMRQATKDGMIGDEGATIRNGRMVIPVLAEYKRQFHGFIHDVSSTGQTVYMEPAESLHLNNEIRQLQAEEQIEIERILRELTNHIRQNAEFLLQNSDSLTELDVIAAKAKVSVQLNAEIPIISEDGRLKLKKAFNPNLMLKNLELPVAQRAEIVPLFLEMLPNERCLMITGPNAGGKSVAMKTVGLCALMMQAGYAIPADPTSEIPIFPGLFVDLGDDQSIENDLSTFSSRLQWMRESAEASREGSLVLIDEAAAGTDPEEGGALFQAFIEWLIDRECTVMVTTHHGSLKVFAHDHPYAVNGSMEFDQVSLSPTYRFKKGIPGSSYAFEIAQRMNIPDEILNRSRTLLGESKRNMESLISELEVKSQQAEELRTQYNDLVSKTKAERNRYQNKLASIDREKEKIREKALKEAKSIMDSANQKVERAVQRIVEQQKADKAQIKEIRSEIEEDRGHIDEAIEQIEERKEAVERVSSEPPQIGDFVRFKNGHTSGELVERKGNNAVVQADGLRLKTKYRNLVKVERPKQHQQKKARSSVLIGESTLNSGGISPTLDIRGQRADAALKNVTQYLDTAIFSGLASVEIIHGKGSGILKDQVHSYLHERTDIKKFELANEDVGGAGCTIVTLN
ncbi:MAG: endonuclease MutS2 [Bacteroidota bacterium]